MEKVALLEQILIVIIFASILLVLQGLINGSIFAMGQQGQINFSAISYNQDRFLSGLIYQDLPNITKQQGNEQQLQQQQQQNSSIVSSTTTNSALLDEEANTLKSLCEKSTSSIGDPCTCKM